MVELVRNSHKPAAFYVAFVCSHAMALMAQLHVHRLEQIQGIFATIAQFLNGKIQKKMTSPSLLRPYCNQRLSFRLYREGQQNKLQGNG